AVYGTTTTQGSGVVGESTAPAGFGVYGQNTAGGLAMFANGNAGQARDKGGWAKAMILVNHDGSVARCYNGITGASAGSCGFAVTNPSLGAYVVDFGFEVDDRFLVATSFYDNGTTAASISFFPTVNSVQIVITYTNDNAGLIGHATDAPFY